MLIPLAKEYLFASYRRSVETGHKFMHERLALKPLLDIGFRLGEGNLLMLQQRVLADIKTFGGVAIINARNTEN